MAAAPNPTQTWREEASCPLCRGLFQDPVSIHCGHNFCRGCISRCWEEEEETQENFSCPRCHQTAPARNLRPNRELAKVIEVAQRLSWQVGAQEGGKVCRKHREVLKLFCQVDQTLICLVCRESQDHKVHVVVPVEEAAEEDKEKLQAHVKVLKDKREKLLELKGAEEGKNLELLERVELERQKVVVEVQKLHQLLEGQERLLLDRLARLDQEILRRKEKNLKELLEGISSTEQQIQELEEKCQQPAWEFLQDSRNILRRLEKDGDQKPTEMTLPEVGQEPVGLPREVTALKEMLRKHRVTVTLDPDTAHPHLLLSADGRGARWDRARRPLPDHPKRFDASRCVLGREALAGGRCYWEVEVASGAAWAVGLAKESVKRKGRVKVNPEAGIWAVGRCGGQWQALTCPPAPLLLPGGDPRVLGVYLDYPEGRVAFWDAGKAAAIFSFPPAAFAGEKLLPLLCLGRGCEVTLAP